MKLFHAITGAALLTCATSAMAWGGAPQWVKAAAATALPSLAGNPRGVVLVDETTTTVSASGEISSLHRTVWRILTSAGRDLGEFAVRSDSETRLKSMHAWSITAKGVETQLSDREGMESSAVPGELYSDQKLTVLRVPNAEPGSIVAIEYERRGRPYS
ncbi:MAG: DUF3857 domain-containing protein, partial [Thermoanaerobaculia bacterium]